MASSAASEQAAGRWRVAFLGPAASYTHQAAKSHFSSDWDLVPVPSIMAVFDAVAAGQAACGVVPFENSTHGPVAPALAGLADREGRYGGLAVCGEVYLRVHHCLLGRRAARSASARGDAQAPVGDDARSAAGAAGAAEVSKSAGAAGAAADDGFPHITRVYSHPQAFGQTAAWVRRHLPPTVETIETSSTSRAAELAATDATGASAAIAGALAAETSGLAVLARGIEDEAENTTRFFVLAKEKAPPQGNKHLLSFTVPHHRPGALADVLACFRRGGLNLTSINSVPRLGHPFQYVFLVEAEATGEQEGAEGEPLAAAAEKAPRTAPAKTTPAPAPDRVRPVLAELAQAAQTVRLLGTWTKPAA